MAKRRRSGRGRRGMGTETRCGCRVVNRPLRGRRDVVMCPGTPMVKILSRKQAAARRGRSFCERMLKPFTKRGGSRRRRRAKH